MFVVILMWWCGLHVYKLSCLSALLGVIENPNVGLKTYFDIVLKHTLKGIFLPALNFHSDYTLVKLFTSFTHMSLNNSQIKKTLQTTFPKVSFSLYNYGLKSSSLYSVCSPWWMQKGQKGRKYPILYPGLWFPKRQLMYGIFM